MYEEYFQLRERPFELSCDQKYLVLTPQHREALSNLEYGVSGRHGITLLLGEAGTGKSTLLRLVLTQDRRPSVGAPVSGVWLRNPMLSRAEFFDSLVPGFQLTSEAALSKSRFLRELEAALIARRQKGIVNVLVVDEAQCMPHELLEEVRLLADLDSQSGALLRVVMAGQPALADRLNDPALWQLKQRIALRCTLLPLDLTDTARYIAARIVRAGGQPAKTFSREAVVLIHQGSRGIPRLINVICDNALLTAFALDQRPVSTAAVAEVCRDFDLPPALAADRLPWAPERAATLAG
jgi:general secretion pathway protein A